MVTRQDVRTHILMREGYGWSFYHTNNIKLWICGYLYDTSVEDVLEKVEDIVDNAKSSIVQHWLKTLCGHYAIVIEYESLIIATVDKICSIPLFISHNDSSNIVLISNHAPLIKEKLKLGNDNLDEGAKLEITMSGYTISNKTLYRDIKLLESGEYLLIVDNKYYNDYFYTYSPWKTVDNTESQFQNRLSSALLKTFDKLKNDLSGRQVVIPLSAGNDSRLIACGLKKVGLKNVVCFSYGRRGNFESIVSKKIANKLEYKWIYIPDVLKEKRNFFKSEEYMEYIDAFKSYAYTHSIQEVYEIFLLKKSNLVDSNAVIINGSCGDFISGGHIRPTLDKINNIKDISEISWKKFLDKHFSLWIDMRTQDNDKYIVSELTNTLSQRTKETIPNINKYQYAAMEFSEYIDRQSKIVIGQQRAYEYFGYEWRMPLWSDEMLNFWEGVPYEYKIDQNLYIKTLKDNNWCDVWHDIRVNNKVIYPISLRCLRFLLKAMFILVGKSKWHRFEKNVLEYFLHPSYALSVTSYISVLFDKRGFRGAYSWISYQMIKLIGKQ